MGYKLLEGEVMIAGPPLSVRVMTPDCPQEGRAGDLKLYRCICHDNEICKYFVAFGIDEGKGCVKCVAPGAEDSGEFAELSQTMDEHSERFEARRKRVSLE